MMSRHPHCDGKLHFNVYRMDKLLACGVDGKLQSSLPMPSWSKHCSSRLSELPITSGKVAEHTGMTSEATSRAGTTSCLRCPCAGAGHGQESPRRRAGRAQTALSSQDLLRAIAHRPRPDD